MLESRTTTLAEPAGSIARAPNRQRASVNRSTLRSLLLAALLLLAQFGASAHALSHLEDLGDARAEAVCTWCLAHADPLGPAPHPQLAGLSPLLQLECAPVEEAAPSPLPFRHAYRSQAPPLCS